MVIKRWRNEPFPPSRFTLGRWGMPLNIFSVLFLCLVFVMSFFPITPNPTVVTMNWNILVYGCVVSFAVIYFFVKGRHQYAGPVEYTKKDY